ncbi:MAG TPA: SIS domain-containing protein [Thermomicrobiales bacterium]|nr:SIS domain-containing protein [Thermomicrobiales bacterium]
MISVVTTDVSRPHAPPNPRRVAVEAALAERKAAYGPALDFLNDRAGDLARTVDLIAARLRAGGRVLVAGNGGSAAEAQHFATELVGRFKRERDPYAVLALTADTSILTALANDYGYEEVFAREVGAYGRPGDVLVLFSTSGESENLVRAAETGHASGIAVVAMTGDRPNRLVDRADIGLAMPSTDTPLTQELHLIVLHVLCDLVEQELSR